LKIVDYTTQNIEYQDFKRSLYVEQHASKESWGKVRKQSLFETRLNHKNLAKRKTVNSGFVCPSWKDGPTS
jgi:hypothetical protein